MKKLISLLAAAILVMLLGFSAFADTPPAYDKVNAKITVNPDGSLSVTEEWDITFFTSDTDKVFTRYIDMPESNELKSVEKYESIDNINVISDGQALDSANGNLDIKKDNGKCAVKITKSTEEKSVHYVLSYIVKGAVKKDSGKARICYKIFGSDTGTLNNITITVNGECISKSDTEILALSDLSPEIGDKKAIFSAEVVRSTMTVDLRVPSESFEKGALASYSKTADAFKAFSSKAKTVVPIIVTVIIMAVISALKLAGTSGVRKKIESSPESYSAQAEFPQETTLPEAAKMLTYYSPASSKNLTNNASGIFALGIAQLIRDGFICADNDSVTINGAKIKEMPSYQKMIAEMFVKHAQNVNETLTLNKTALDSILKDTEFYPDYMYSLVSNYIKLMPEYNNKFFKSDENKKTYASLCLIKKDMQNSASAASVFALLCDNQNTDERQILPIGINAQTSETLTPPSDGFNAKTDFISFVCALTSKIDSLFKK